MSVRGTDDVLVFHPGTQHSWQTALALQHLGRLRVYATSIFEKADAWPYRAVRYLPEGLAAKARSEFARFSHPAIDPDKVLTFGWHEWAERVARRAGLDGLAREIDRIGNAAFGRRVAKFAAGQGDFALWGYNGSSLCSFRAASGRKTIYDRTTPSLRKVNAAIDEIEERFPQWIAEPGQRYSQQRIDLEDEEQALADVIVTGSEFARDSVIADDPALTGKLRVLPYCYDEALFGQLPEVIGVGRDEPVRFLFVGGISARKGVHLLIEALAGLTDSAATLTLVGRMDLPEAAFAPFANRVTHIPAVPRSAIPAIMRQHHAFVFPSFYEGGGIALYEALASGLALIQTPNASHAVDGGTGIMLDCLDVESVRDAMLRVVDDRDLLNGWREAAPKRAEAFTFTRYRDGIASLLDEVL
ncbi:glycosyltransferase family 4 protein [Croceicoccus sediminis]|uniref:glycosyltransferase family 4 protein n=1 Tax=Croceicoccus sediminis TaxID=2571150 RepID=UPI001183FB03|nr:glycosyltransferase family 4 protein [Croceicoccus sediminis]